MLTEKGIKDIKGEVGITLISGITFAVPQIIIAKYLGADLPALVASICSMACTIICAKLMNKEKVQTKQEDKIELKQRYISMVTIYTSLCVNTFSKSFSSSINAFLAKASSNIHIYTGGSTSTTAFSWINTQV